MARRSEAHAARRAPSREWRATLRHVETLAEGRYRLRRYTFDYRRGDGAVQRLAREVYERGDTAVALLYSRCRRSVVLTRQFRLPVFVSGHGDGLIMEAAGGLVEGDTPAQAARREVEEETGYRLGDVQKVLTAYMAPGVISERVHFFVAALDGAERLSSGGGRKEEGEDLGVVELPFDEAIALVAQGEIVDGRTILLLQYAQLQRLV